MLECTATSRVPSTNVLNVASIPNNANRACLGFGDTVVIKHALTRIVRRVIVQADSVYNVHRELGEMNVREPVTAVAPVVVKTRVNASRAHCQWQKKRMLKIKVWLHLIH